MNEVNDQNGVNGVNDSNSVSNQFETASQTNTYNNSGSQLPKKNKSSVVLLVVVLLAVLGVGGYFLYQKLFNSKNVFKTAIDNSFDYLEGNFADYDSFTGSYSIAFKGNSSDSSIDSVMKVLNKANLSLNYGVDYKNKVMDISFDSNYGSDTLFKGNVSLQDNYGYIFLDGVYDKYLKVSMDEFDELFNKNNKEDIKNVLEGFRSALKDSLKDEYFKKESAEFNGKKVTKTSLELNAKVVKEITNSVIDSLTKNKKFLDSFAAISGESVDEIKEELNSAKDGSYDDMTLVINAYTNKGSNDFVGMELVQDSTKITVTKDGDTYKFDIAGLVTGSLKVTENGDNVNSVLTVSAMGTSLEVTMNESVKPNGKVEKRDVSNNVDVEDLTEEDSSKISENLLNGKGFSSLQEDLGSLDLGLGLGDDDYDYDYDYDYDSSDFGLDDSNFNFDFFKNN